MRKSKYKIIFFVFLSMLLSEIKIGYLNADKILLELDEVRQVQIELEKEQRKIESEYKDLEIGLDSLFRSYEQTQMLMSDERRSKEEEKIRNRQAELQRFQMENVGPQGKIYQIQEQLMAPLYTKIDEAIQKIGRRDGYDYIFNVVSGGIVYALPQYDITEQVLIELDSINNSIPENE